LYLKQIGKIKIKDIYILGISSFLIFIGNLVSFSSFKLNEIITNRYVIILLLLILLLPCMRWKYPRNFKLLAIWYLFSLSILLSKIVNEEYDLINILILTIFIPFLFCIERRYLRLLCWAIVIAFIPFVYQYGASGFNSYGITTALIGINIAILLYLSEGQKTFAIFVVIVFTTILLTYLRSRTALISLLIGGFVLIYFSINSNKSKRRIFYYIVFAIAIIILCYFYFDVISELMFNKWRLSEEDITTGRMDIWMYLLRNDVSAFGWGESYFWNNFAHGDAHNIFMQSLGRYGLISLIVFLFLLVYIFKLIMKVKGKERKAFLVFFGEYIFLGMFENTLFVDIKTFSISLMFLIYLGLLLQASKRSASSEHFKFI